MEEYVAQYLENGCTVIPNFLSAEQVAALKQEYARLVDGMNEDEHRAIFTTSSEQVQERGNYFLESGDKIRFFFEDGVFDEQGKLKVEKHLAMNKVGHALHEYSDVCKKVTFDEKVTSVLRAAGFRHPAICQSMFILKQPKVGGEVRTHQDATFLYCEPEENSLIGFWIALDQCSKQNGCLEFIPGSHKLGLINGRRMVRVTGDEKLQSCGPQDSSMVPNAGANQMAPSMGGSGNGSVSLAFVGGATTCEGEFVPLECQPGSLVLIHGLVVHRSAPNLSNLPRNSYAFHAIETDKCEWSAKNWLQPTEKLGFLHFY